jgi:hypothetical protein
MTRDHALETYRAIHEARRTLETAGMQRGLEGDESRLIEALKLAEVLLLRVGLS